MLKVVIYDSPGGSTNLPISDSSFHQITSVSVVVVVVII